VPWWIFFKKKLYPTMFFHTTCGNVMTCVWVNGVSRIFFKYKIVKYL
jgi:hypothetical protein